jgi:ornithine cyclodeaminase/alanine dehydrogenase-like protein (mu-crystallin family)
VTNLALGVAPLLERQTSRRHLLVLRQEPARGAQAHRWADGLHLRRVRRAVHGHHRRGEQVLPDAVVVVDDRRLAVEMGAVGGARLGPEVIHAELGEVLAGKRSGRTDASQITIFASVGLAFQDLAAGWLAYTLARQHGIGRSVDLLG